MLNGALLSPECVQVVDLLIFKGREEIEVRAKMPGLLCQPCGQGAGPTSGVPI